MSGIFQENKKELFISISSWTIAFILISSVLIQLNYRSRDPDSALYSDMTAKMAERPLKEFIAPQWWGLWNNQGPFHEHPVGFFIFPVLLTKIGLPADQSVYIVNAVFQLLTLFLLAKIAEPFCSAIEARALLWIAQLLPIAFAYRIRGNHEQAVLFFLLLALFGLERVTRNFLWTLCLFISLLATMLIKGLFVLFAIAICLFWALFRSGNRKIKGRIVRILSILISLFLLAICVHLYEQLYVASTGDSFLQGYLGKWIGYGMNRGENFFSSRLINVVWYMGRLVWFSFPWSIVFFVLIWMKRRSLYRWYISLGETREHHFIEGVALSLGMAAIYVIVLSTMNRTVDRYIFPIHYMIGTVGIIASIRRWPRWQRAVAKLDRRVAYWPAAVWFAGCALSLLGNLMRLPYIKVWTK